MGKKVAHKVRSQENMELIGVVSYEFDEKVPEKSYSSLAECDEKADVIIDFSHPNNLDDILDYALANKTKLVIATTGYSEEQLNKIEEASKKKYQSFNLIILLLGFKCLQKCYELLQKNFLKQVLILRF